MNPDAQLGVRSPGEMKCNIQQDERITSFTWFFTEERHAEHQESKVHQESRYTMQERLHEKLEVWLWWGYCLPKNLLQTDQGKTWKMVIWESVKYVLHFPASSWLRNWAPQNLQDFIKFVNLSWTAHWIQSPFQYTAMHAVMIEI
jgi:hypothetical protein